ncbi:MAG TPA: hypothetical protein VF092_09270 [Longimicrobium sp.]
MTLCDAGPLIALVDRRDAHHDRCSAALARLPFTGLITTWPCFAEAMHVLGRDLGWRGQDELWTWLDAGIVRLHKSAEDEWLRMRVLMRDYADTPMDLGDASLVAASETLNVRRVFTIDGHFYIYRQRQGHAFDVVQ